MTHPEDRTAEVVGEVADERARQRERYSEDHDQDHNRQDWAFLIASRLTRRAGYRAYGRDEWRHALVEVAAVAVAAIEAHDRAAEEGDDG